VGALGAITAIFAATTGFDAEQGAELNFVPIPVVEIDPARLIQKLEQRLVINRLNFGQG
jgi:hypothetical protein